MGKVSSVMAQMCSARDCSSYALIWAGQTCKGFACRIGLSILRNLFLNSQVGSLIAEHALGLPCNRSTRQLADVLVTATSEELAVSPGVHDAAPQDNDVSFCDRHKDRSVLCVDARRGQQASGKGLSEGVF